MKGNPQKKLFEEIIASIFGIAIGDATTTFGSPVILFIIGLAFILIPISKQNNIPNILIGIFLCVISLIIFLTRLKRIKRKDNNE